MMWIIYLQVDPYTDAQIIEALDYVLKFDGTDNEVDIINMSFEGHEEISTALNTKLNKVAETRTIVAAAGRISFS